MSDINIGSLIEYKSGSSELLWEDKLDNKLGIVVKITTEQIVSPYILQKPFEFKIYFVYIHGNITRFPKESLIIHIL
jgi:hypothetical protein